ncbi:WD40 repeat-like protein [Mycena maculata]|uniref:WD40 repeat-like protein n=1 Tax=Mycena maculata TaxID=230809 RepID=A0AAD7I1B8_9AGAR|nr:WD40 repeat-like protein [Mycena maculata]
MQATSLGKSMQVSKISASILGGKETKKVFLHASENDSVIRKQSFKKKAEAVIKFKPPHSVSTTLTMELVKHHMIHKDETLSIIKFTVQDAQSLLLQHQVFEIADHTLFDGKAEFKISFSMKPTPGQDAIQESDFSEVKSILEHLGKSYAVFEGLFSLSSGIGELNTIAKAVLSSVEQVNQILHMEDKCVQDIRVLLADMAHSLDWITECRKFTTLRPLKQVLENVDQLMRDTATFISKYKDRSHGRILVSLTLGTDTRDELIKLTRRFKSFKEDLGIGLSVQTGLAVADIIALEQDNKVLQGLRLHHQRSRRGHDPCMEGTRADVLKTIEEWIDAPQGPNLFWLHGHPGTGKSAIATTTRDRLQAKGRLGSSFFFRREDFTVQRPESLWCSVAYDLAQLFPSIRHVAVDQVKLHNIDPEGSSHDVILNQLLWVILGVSIQMEHDRLPVVVIDALDECGGQQQDKNYQKDLLATLTKWQSTQTKIKIFVTSRDEGQIRAVLGKGGLLSRILEVGQNVTPESSRDIHQYLKHNFDSIRHNLDIKDPWPTKLELQSLTERAAGLFIWASTVVQLVEEGPPMKVLRRVLTTGETGTDTLSQLYMGILNSRFTKETNLFNNLAGAIIVSRIPLTLEELCKLMPELSYDDVSWACKQLKSVLDTQAGLRFVHQSFVDFLVNLHPGDQFQIDKMAHEQKFADACFSSMRELHFNMGDVETSYLRNDSNRGLVEKIPAQIKYSCQFWATHLKECGSEGHTTHKFVEFMKSQLLYWLEVMSIQGMVGQAVQALHLLTTFRMELRDRVKDALLFVRCFAIPISTAVPHIYLSAMVFAPANSITRETYLQDIPGVLGLKTGRECWWPGLQGVLRGHNGEVNSVAFSPDGRRIVSGSYDNTVRIWDAETQEQIREPLHGHNSWVTSVAFSPDGRRIVSGSNDNTVRIWDAETQEQIREPLHGHNDWVRSVAFSPDGRRIVSGSKDNTVRIWDAETQEQIREPLHGHNSWVTSVAFSPDGRRIVSGSDDNTVRIWDAETQEQIREPLHGHNSWVTSVAFSPDGRRIVSGSNDNTVRIWDAETQEQIREPLHGHNDWVRSVAFSPDGRRIVSGSKDNTVRIWDAETQEQIREPLHGHNSWVTSVAFSPDGRRIVSGSDDNTVRIWDAETQEQIREPLHGHNSWVTSVAFSPNGRRIVSGSNDNTVRIWDAETQEQIREPLHGHNSRVTSVAFSPDGRRIVSGSDDNTVRIWDAETQEQIREPLHGHNNSVISVAFSPDGRRIVSGSYDNTVRIWDAETQEQIREPLHGHNDWVRSVAFSPNGRRIVSGSNDNTLRIWDAETQEQIREPLHGHNDWVRSVAFSPNGRRIVSGSNDNTLRIWDAETQEQIREPLHGHNDWVRSVAFSPNGRRIVSGSNDNTLRIWDAETQEQIREPLHGHNNSVISVAFSPDGRRIVSGSYDNTVRIWDAETQEQIREPLHGHNDWVRSVAFSPDGRRIVSGSNDNTVRIWDAGEPHYIGRSPQYTH